MFKSNIGLKLTKSAGLMLFVIACQSLMSDRVLANNADNLIQENIEIAQDIELNEIAIYCSTILNPQLLQELFPDLVIETKILSDENAAELITCPEEKTVFLIKATNQDNLITQRKEVIETITKFYIDNGYITSRAMPYGRQDILLEEDRAIITIEGATRLEKYVLRRISPATNPFNTKDIEERLRLLKADSLFENIEATLKPAEENNATELVVKVTEAKSFFGSFGIDNDSPPSIGSEELNFILGDRNLTGIGDSLAISYSPRLEAFTDTYDLNFNYRAPINSMNGTINLGINLNRNEIIDGEFENFDIQGESETYSLNYRQPVILTPRQELAFSVGFSYRDGQTFLLQNGFPFGEGPDKDGVSQTSVFNIGQEYILRQASGAWGIRSLFRIGVDLFDATNNDSSVPDSQFFSWLAQMQRVQVLNDNNLLIIQGDLQLTPNSLLPSEQFTVGGGQSVKGYRQNVRSGDNGFRFAIEDRITIAKNDAEQPVFLMAPFFNLGVVWNQDDNPNKVPDQNFIAALGLGLLWQPIEGLNFRLDYAPPLIDLDDRGDDIQDDGLHFSANYSF